MSHQNWTLRSKRDNWKTFFSFAIAPWKNKKKVVPDMTTYRIYILTNIEIYYPYKEAFYLTKWFWCYSLKKLRTKWIEMPAHSEYLFFLLLSFFFCLISEAHCHVAPWKMTWNKRNPTFSVAPGVIFSVLQRPQWCPTQFIVSPGITAQLWHFRVSETCPVWRPCNRGCGDHPKSNLAALWNEGNTLVLIRCADVHHRCRKRERPCDEPQIFISPLLKSLDVL